MKDVIQKLSNIGWDGLESSEKDTLRKYYNKSDLQEISNNGWEGVSDSTKNNVRKVFNSFNTTPTESEKPQIFSNPVRKLNEETEDKSMFTRVSEAVYPRLSNLPEGGSRVAATALDLMSLPGRLGAGLIKSNQDVLNLRMPTPLENVKATTSNYESNVPTWLPQKVQDVANNGIVQGVVGVAEDIQRSPFTVIPSVGKIGEAAMSVLPKFGQTLLQRTPSVVQGASRMAGEGAMLPAMMTLDRASKGQETRQGDIDNEVKVGLALGLIPGVRQFSKSSVDKASGKKIVSELNRGRTTPNPIVSESTEADKIFREGLKRAAGEYFDDALSTKENINRLYNQYDKIPVGSINIGKTAMEDLYEIYGGAIPKLDVNKTDFALGALGAATGNAAIAPVALGRKVLTNPESFYVRPGEAGITPLSLGRTLYQMGVDATRTQDRK